MCADPEPRLTGITAQPLSRVQWLTRDRLVPNTYNPNHVAPPELALLKISLLEDGWTQPIVAFERPDGKLEIIDGEHRWRTADDPEVSAMTGGKVPVVTLHGTEADRMIATVRHNRARGEHGVLPMSTIVAALRKAGLPASTIEHRLQMEDEEVDRLSERAGLPEVISRTHGSFSSGWVPGKE